MKRLYSSIRLLPTSMVLVVLALPSPVFADDAEEARKHFENGLALADDNVKDYQGALVEFEASVGLHPTKAGLFNLALCYRRLSRYGEALMTYGRLLEEFAGEIDDDLRDQVQGDIDDIRRITAELVIEVDQPGAKIRINGDPVGESPLADPLYLGPREYEVTVRLDGFEPLSREIKLVSGQQRVLELELEPLRAMLTVKTNSVDGATIELDGEEVGTTPLAPLSVEPGRHTVTITHSEYESVDSQHVNLASGEKGTVTFVLVPLAKEPAIEEDKSKLSPLFWTGLALTVATGVTSGALYGAARSKYDDYDTYNTKIDENYPTHPDAATWYSERDKAEKDAAKYEKFSLGFLIGAGVFAAATGFVLWYDLTREEEDEQEDVEVTAAPGGLVVSF
jgi:hypothetical protein